MIQNEKETKDLDDSKEKAAILAYDHFICIF